MTILGLFSDYVCVMDLGLFELSLLTSDGNDKVCNLKIIVIVFHISKSIFNAEHNFLIAQTYMRFLMQHLKN